MNCRKIHSLTQRHAEWQKTYLSRELNRSEHSAKKTVLFVSKSLGRTVFESAMTACCSQMSTSWFNWRLFVNKLCILPVLNSGENECFVKVNPQNQPLIREFGRIDALLREFWPTKTALLHELDFLWKNYFF